MGPFQERFLCDCHKARMIREHVRLPFLYHGQIATPLQLLYQAVHKLGELPECKIAKMGTPRVHFGEIVCN